jgi:2-hydroxy-3-keto-5-methylthiopentenyl-1-phosphate phosphatase
MSPAALLPTFTALGAPISLLIDYDGTISRLDVGDALLGRLVADRAAVARKDAQYDSGEVGSRELLRWDMDELPQDQARLLAIATGIPQDETLSLLVEKARAHGAAVEVVSDGLGFYIEANLARLGLTDLPVATNRNAVAGGGSGMGFPFGHPTCLVCGTCKRQRVFQHQRAGRVVVLIGDGTSDRYAAAHADVVFAKGKLVDICRAEGWPTLAWTSFADIAAWLESGLRDGDLPRTFDEVAVWRGQRGLATRAFICGPEVWGEGRTTPPLQARAPVG